MILLPRHRLTRQPQGAVELSPEYDRAVTAWLGSQRTHNAATGEPLTVVGSRTVLPNAGGVGDYSTSYPSANWYTVRTINPSVADWPGVTVVAQVLAKDTGAGRYPSLSSCMVVGEFFGGWNLSLETNADATPKNLIFFRAGDSSTVLTPTRYNSIPSSNEWEIGELITIVATWDKSTISMWVSRDGALAKNSAAHSFAWDNATATENIGGYARSGNRSLTHVLNLAAVLPYAVPDGQADDLVRNPWQIFRAPPRRLYVQVGGGTSTRTVTAAGGFDLGGTSNLLRQVARAASGGIDLGGTAAQARVVARVPSGGFDLGGVAPALRYRVSTGSGGVAFGGTAPAVGFRGITVEGDGGIAIGGEVIPLRYRTVSADGGIALGGTAAVSFVGGAITARVIRVVIPGGGVRSYTI